MSIKFPLDRLPQSLSLRLTLYYALAFLLLLGVSFFFLYWSIGTVLDQRMDEDLEEDVAEFSLLLESTGTDRLFEEFENEVAGGEHETVFLKLYRRDLNVAYATDLESWKGLEIDPDLIRAQFDPTSDPELRSLSLSSREDDTRIIYGALSSGYVLVLGESLDERDDIMEILSAVFTVVFLIALPFTAFLIWLLTRHAISGIKSVSTAALDIKAGNLDRRVNAHNQVTEIQTLADTFDAMAERIQKLIRNMREMTDNIAHDLRSPLGRVRLLSESVLGSSATENDYLKTAQITISECDRLIEMINVSLDVAETEAGVASGGHTIFDLAELVEDACELFESVAEEKNITLIRQRFPSCRIEGDINSVQRMVANVLDNAVKFTQDGGSIRVSLTITDQLVNLVIRDSGIGIDKAEFDAIFHRFFRVEPSRSSNGCGLGLSFARAVARAHGGEITVRSEKSRYTEFSITMPLNRTASPILSGEYIPA